MKKVKMSCLFIFIVLFLFSCSKNSSGDGSDLSEGNLSDSENSQNNALESEGERIDFEECAGVFESAQNQREPAEIFFIIDNSKSMYDEIVMVQNNMNEFSRRIMDSGIDPRIIMISCLPGECGTKGGGGGDSYGICIDPPLGAQDGCQIIDSEDEDLDIGLAPVTDDNNLPWYKHISIRVPSMKGLEWLLRTYDDTDLVDSGWNDMLRSYSTKHVVVISDDGEEMTADEFHSAFTALNPLLEGYIFHGIFSFISKDEAPEGDPCAIYAAPSSPGAEPPILWDTYPELVEITGGVSQDLCLQNFDLVFEEIGTSVIINSKISCEWSIPAPPEGEELNPNLVNVEFRREPDAEGVIIGRLEDINKCSEIENGWYYDDLINPKKIYVCPQTCQRFQSYDSALLNIQFGCETQRIDII